MIFFTKRDMKQSPDITYKEASEKQKEKTTIDVSQSFTQEKFDMMIDAMEKARLAEYATYVAHPFRLLFMNFLIGLARGLGGTIGLALVLAVSGVILKNIIYMNLPVIGEWLQNILSMAQIYKGS